MSNQKPKIEFNDPRLRALFNEINGAKKEEESEGPECEICPHCQIARDLGLAFIEAFNNRISGDESNIPPGNATFQAIAELAHPLLPKAAQIVVCITTNPEEFLEGGAVYIAPFPQRGDYE